MAAMRDIAAAAEMQAASVYYYFESKEELLWAVWEKGGLELLHRGIGVIFKESFGGGAKHAENSNREHAAKGICW